MIDLPFRGFEVSLRDDRFQSSYRSTARPTLPHSSLHIDPQLLTLNECDKSGGHYDIPCEVQILPNRSVPIDAPSGPDPRAKGWAIGGPVSDALKSVMPIPMANEASSDYAVTKSGTQIFSSPLYRQILFSVANNFAGLSAFSISEVIQFLQEETSEKLYQMIRFTPGYSSRAIAQNLFKGAIEVGDAKIVGLLLIEKVAGIDPNEQVCIVKGEKFTPIERASDLRHKNVIRVLLDHDADVNKRLEDHSGAEGPLELALGRYTVLKYTRIDPEIFQMLLKAGSDIGEFHISSLITRKEGELFGMLMSFLAQKNHVKWSKWGVFRDAIKFLDDQTSMNVINIMLNVGADLNYHVENSGGARRVIDVAAQRGNIDIVKLLLNSGAKMTGDTLACAVASGNEGLIRFLLNEKADINSIGSLGITPLAAAIRLKNDEIVKLLVDQKALTNLRDKKHFSAALKAASEVGDTTWIDYLVHFGGDVGPEDLGYALVIATRDGRDEAAKLLIDAGANANISSAGSGPPLYEALKRRNAALVLLLLDADADPNCNHGPPSLQLATAWGDASVVKALIFAGANVNDLGNWHGSKTALTIAVKRKDAELVQVLFDAGADINNHEARRFGGTALEAAAQNGDMNMARKLLDRGADPNDSEALSEALAHPRELSDLLIERYRARYPVMQPGYGSGVLQEAIKRGDQPVVESLLEHGVDPNGLVFPYEYSFIFADDVEMGDGTTPFGFAIVSKQADATRFVEMLLQSGCHPDSIVSQAGSSWRSELPATPRITAFLAAIGTKNTSVIALLIRYGADVNFPARMRVKRTPLQRAAEVGSLEIVQLLLNHGAQVNAPAAERGGGTAFQLAAIKGFIPIACLLLNEKADVDVPGSKGNGRTALEGAAENGRLDMVKVLLNHGAAANGKDTAQIDRAKALARSNGNFPSCDLLEDAFRAREQDAWPVLLSDDNGDDYINWDP
jgi:ankyrin repeat protein